MKRTLIALVVLALLAVACAAPPAAPAPAPAAVPEPTTPAATEAPAAPAAAANAACVIHVGPINDNGWTQAHHEGLVTATQAVGWGLKEIESIFNPSDVERITREYAQSGDCAVIVGTAQNFDPDMRKVAAEFPDTPFLILHGDQPDSNIGIYFGRMYIPRYLTGILAGSMSESKIIGFVGAYENNPQVARGRDAFIKGVAEVCPECEVKVVYTNNWFDPPAETEAAAALIGAGADILAQHQDSDAVQQRAAQAGVMGIGYDSDMRNTAGEGVLTSPIWDWALYYMPQFQAIRDGTWASEWYWAPEVAALAPFSSRVPDDVRALVAAYQQKVLDGEITIFDMPDAELWGYGTQ
jgi:basic membrane protein A and related proteins